jgi:hypothetical protein
MSSREVNGVVNDEVVDEQLILFFKVYKKTLRSRQGLKREKQEKKLIPAYFRRKIIELPFLTALPMPSCLITRISLEAADFWLPR